MSNKTITAIDEQFIPTIPTAEDVQKHLNKCKEFIQEAKACLANAKVINAMIPFKDRVKLPSGVILVTENFE